MVVFLLLPVTVSRVDVIFPAFRFLSQMVIVGFFSFSKKVNFVCNQFSLIMWLFWSFGVDCFYFVCVGSSGSVHNEVKWQHYYKYYSHACMHV